MAQPRTLVSEPDLHELLNDEIGRLVMRADRVGRLEVEALVTRVKAPKTKHRTCTELSRRTESLS